MNLCLLLGQIITIPQYNFFYNSKKHISIIEFKVKLNKDIILDVQAFDEKADFIYQFFDIKEFICFTGWLDTDMKVNIIEIEKADT